MNRKRVVLLEWCRENGIKYHQAISMAMVSDSTARHLLADRRPNIAASHRLWLLTNLPEFKLNDQQFMQYTKLLDQRDLEYWEDRIALYFIEAFTNSRTLPAADETLCYKNDHYQKKDKLVPFLVEKFFQKKNVVIKQFSVPGKGSKKKNNTNAKVNRLIRRTNDEQDVVVGFGDLMKDLIHGDSEVALNQFLNKWKKDLQKIYGFLAILMDENPVQAAHSYNQAKKHFTNQ